MNPTLAKKASGLPLALCKDLRRFDTQPLVLSDASRGFSAHFLKLTHVFAVPTLATPSSKYPVCVEIRVPSETAEPIRAALDQVGWRGVLGTHGVC